MCHLDLEACIGKGEFEAVLMALRNSSVSTPIHFIVDALHIITTCTQIMAQVANDYEPSQHQKLQQQLHPQPSSPYSPVNWPEDKAAEYHAALMLSNQMHRDKVASESQLALLPPAPVQPAVGSVVGSSNGGERDKSNSPPPRRHVNPELVAAAREKLGLED